MGTASHTERQTELGSRDPRWGLQVALQGWRIGTPGRKSFIERGGWRFSLGQARRMGHWASSLATAVFALPLLSSPLPDVLIAFSLLCFFVSWLIFPLPSLHGARLHFLCPGIFISFWRFSYPFSFFFFFFSSSGFPLPSWPETLIFCSSEGGVFFASFSPLGDNHFMSFLYPEASPSFFFKAENLHFRSLVFSGPRRSPSVLSGLGNTPCLFPLSLKVSFPVACIFGNLHFLLFLDLETLITVFYSGHGNPSRPGLLYFLFRIHPLLSSGWLGCRGWEGRKVGGGKSRPHFLSHVFFPPLAPSPSPWAGPECGKSSCPSSHLLPYPEIPKEARRGRGLKQEGFGPSPNPLP